MALTQYTNSTQIIRALDDEPNDVGGLTASQLKAKFDQFADEFTAYFNAVHIPEVAAVETRVTAAETRVTAVELKANNNGAAIAAINARRLRNLMGVKF